MESPRIHAAQHGLESQFNELFNKISCVSPPDWIDPFHPVPGKKLVTIGSDVLEEEVSKLLQSQYHSADIH